MTKRGTIKEVFDICKEKGLQLYLGSSYCSGPPEETINDLGLIGKGWVCAEDENDDRIIEDIDGEGSAEIKWFFGPPKKIVSVGKIILKAFTDLGYIVEWNKNMGGQISAVIEEEDLPIEYLEKLNKEEDEEEDEDYEEDEEEDEEERVDPEEEVVFNKEDEEKTIFTDDDEDEEEDEDEEDEEKSGPILDPSSDEDDTVCPKGCTCINCEEERQ
jgi:hypothetical protein